MLRTLATAALPLSASIPSSSAAVAAAGAPALLQWLRLGGSQQAACYSSEAFKVRGRWECGLIGGGGPQPAAAPLSGGRQQHALTGALP